MSISIKEAEATADALLAASEMMEVRQVRYELKGRADEWYRAAVMAAEYADDGVIEMCSAVSRGMMVAYDGYGAPSDGFCRVRRKLNDGLSLHLESEQSPAGFYVNYLDPTSPVVVKA